MLEKRYSIGEFAKKVGYAVITLRNWDRTGKLVANRTASNWRYYTDEHLEKVKEMERINTEVRK